MAIPQEKVDQAIEMRKQGHSYRKIAWDLKLSEGWCKNNLKGIIDTTVVRKFGTYDKSKIFYTEKDPKNILNIWQGMIHRTTSEVFKEGHHTYKDATVSDNFLDFEYFLNWARKQKGYGYKGWELDKDILVKGNKHYSEDTCCFVPKELNGLFKASRNIDREFPVGVKLVNKYYYQAVISIGFESTQYLGQFCTVEEAFDCYKIMKEGKIKQLATIYKNYLEPRVYDVLVNYAVEMEY